jgi:hypothetical protein
VNTWSGPTYHTGTIYQEEHRWDCNEGICGLCGKPGAAKIPHPNYWPGERKPTTKVVHSKCEFDASKEAYDHLTEYERNQFLRELFSDYESGEDSVTVEFDESNSGVCVDSV